MTLRELKDLPGVIISRPIFNNIRCDDDTVLMLDSEWKLKEHLEEVFQESKKKVLTIKCQNSKMHGCQHKGQPKLRATYWERQNQEDAKMNLKSVVTDDRKHFIEIQRHVGILKDIFQK